MDSSFGFAGAAAVGAAALSILIGSEKGRPHPRPHPRPLPASSFLATAQGMGRAQFRSVGTATVGSILFKGMLVEFLIDTADLEAVRPLRWHLASNTYIATSVQEAATDASGQAITKKKEIYLHTFLAKPPAGKVVQHISKNGLDNRRENLRIVDAAQAVPAAAIGKKRSVELPPLCGVAPGDIPKHIWYVQANGYHRDRFAIEFKTEGILWKSTSSKKVSLKEKLDLAKARLQELYAQYPHLNPAHEEDLVQRLQTTFDAILKEGQTRPPIPSSPQEGSGTRNTERQEM